MQQAIEHNRKVFANRVRQEDRVIVKKAFDAWRAARWAAGSDGSLHDRSGMPNPHPAAAWGQRASCALFHPLRTYPHTNPCPRTRPCPYTYTLRYGSVAKQQLLKRVVARLKRGLLSRAFLAWKDKFNLVDKFLAMRRKVRRSTLGSLVVVTPHADVSLRQKLP